MSRSVAAAVGRVIVTLVPVAACALTLGCGAWDDEARARDVAVRVLECFDTTMTRTEEHRFRAEGCGRRADVACSSGALEPVCIQVRARDAASAEAERGPSEDIASAADGDEDEGEPVGDDTAADDEDSAGASGAVGAGAATAGGESSVQELAVRRGLDARAADVLACVGLPRVAVRAVVHEDGAVTLGLSGPLAGSPEEGCVRSALGGVRVAPGATAVFVHLVREAPSAAVPSRSAEPPVPEVETPDPSNPHPTP